MDQSQSDAPLRSGLFSHEAGISLIASGTQPHSPCDLRTCEGRAHYSIPLLDVVGFDSFGGGAAELLPSLRGASYIRLFRRMCETVAATVRVRQNDVDERWTTATWHCLRMVVAERVCPFRAEAARGHQP